MTISLNNTPTECKVLVDVLEKITGVKQHTEAK